MTAVLCGVCCADGLALTSFLLATSTRHGVARQRTTSRASVVNNNNMNNINININIKRLIRQEFAKFKSERVSVQPAASHAV